VIIADRVIAAPNLSVAWADAFAYLFDHQPHQATNLMIRIEDPLAEDDTIRGVAEHLLDELGLQDVTEVANTIFPAEWAADYPDAEELGADYREHYSFLRSLGSSSGTYFGRIVAYPDPGSGETIDQLRANVDKLKAATKRNRVYKSVYEFNIYSAARDRKKDRGFPCLAHVGMHIGTDERLHATAQYRSHDVVSKGYGNYLGLGGLLGYVAQSSERPPGELLVVAGGAFFDAPIRRLRDARTRLEPFRVAAA
jgi:thymidylate synthase